MYRIIGTDQKEYGPVSADEVRRWIAERRLHANSLVRAEAATEWKALSLYPEFSNALPVPGPAPFSTGAATTTAPQNKNAMATNGFVLSCISLACCGCGPFAVLGIIFSWMGLAQANRDPARPGRSLAIAGIVIGAFAIIETIIGLVAGLFGQLIDAISKH